MITIRKPIVGFLVLTSYVLLLLAISGCNQEPVVPQITHDTQEPYVSSEPLSTQESPNLLLSPETPGTHLSQEQVGIAETPETNRIRLDITDEFECPIFLAEVRRVLGIGPSSPVINTEVEHIKSPGWELNDKDITSLAGIEYFTALEVLFIERTLITELDLSNNPYLTHLSANINRIRRVNLSNNPNLTNIQLRTNELTHLDVTSCSDLDTLLVDGNKLTQLDLSNNPGLTFLWADDNELTGLDLTNNQNITTLTVSGNQLTELVLLNMPRLNQLHASGNYLSSLDLSSCPALAIVSVYDNKLSNIDISNNPGLRRLEVRNNQLASLDVSNTDLRFLDVRWNNIQQPDDIIGWQRVLVLEEDEQTTDPDEIAWIGHYTDAGHQSALWFYPQTLAP